MFNWNCSVIEATARYVNGEGTAVEINLYYSTKEKDCDGEFDSVRDISVPIETSLEDAERLAEKMLGKKFNICLKFKD